jgi:hypothetical protein
MPVRRNTGTVESSLPHQLQKGPVIGAFSLSEGKI